jgi:butyrate kinase
MMTLATGYFGGQFPPVGSAPPTIAQKLGKEQGMSAVVGSRHLSDEMVVVLHIVGYERVRREKSRLAWKRWLLFGSLYCTDLHT